MLLPKSFDHEFNGMLDGWSIVGLIWWVSQRLSHASQIVWSAVSLMDDCEAVVSVDVG